MWGTWRSFYYWELGLTGGVVGGTELACEQDPDRRIRNFRSPRIRPTCLALAMREVVDLNWY